MRNSYQKKIHPRFPSIRAASSLLTNLVLHLKDTLTDSVLHTIANYMD